MPENPNLTLLIGGARSGKSAHAELLVSQFQPPWIYVATAETLDDEMRVRVMAHRQRRDERWQTLEAPLDLAGTLKHISQNSPVLVDCLTLWLSNHLLAGHNLEAECAALADALSNVGSPCFVVANEVGQGIVPEHTLSREFRDAAGRLNQMIAALAGQVVLMVAGIPMQVK